MPQPLLGRREVVDDLSAAAQRLAGLNVCVTGAGGSVGPALAEAILLGRPARLVLIDNHEASLWDLHRRFSNRAETVSLVLADVRNRDRLNAVFADSKPDLVFHLAAYKHVPFGEVFSNETFEVNVLGTEAVLGQAIEHGAQRFVYPSSDKACDPPSLYGATKRLSELLVRDAARKCGSQFGVARFVNILGTRGSVVETFTQQIKDDQPFTITDREMTRYWISMREAVWLLLSVAALPEGGRTLMIDARDEISVVEMAERIWRLLRGDELLPQLAFGTPRPGERLHEALLSSSEHFEAGPESGLLSVVDDLAEEHLERIQPIVHRLTTLSISGKVEDLRKATMEAAHSLQ